MIWFVGTKSHATVAEYVFGTLAAAANKLSLSEYYRYESRVRATGEQHKARGFRESWLDAFVLRIFERLDEARRASIAQAQAAPGMALMVLKNELTRAEQYVEQKFQGKKGLASLDSNNVYNRDGRAWGRAAADRVAFTKGVDGEKTGQRRLK